MKEKLFSIGKTAELTNVSVDQLRNYDKIGLLSPQVRGNNNYRYYTEKQFEEILLIKELKRIGVPLKLIQNLLNNHDLETIRNTLEENMFLKRAALNNLQMKYNALVDTLINLERAIADKNKAQRGRIIQDDRFAILPIAERPILSIRRKSKCYKTNHYTERYLELQNLAETMEVDAGRSWFIIYHDSYHCIFDQGEEAEGDMEFFVNIQHGLITHDPHYRIFGGFLAACATYFGPYDDDTHRQTYEELSNWAINLGYHPKGISYQELVIGRNMTNNPEDFITKIYLPLNVHSI